MPPLVDLSGQRFGRLLVVKRQGTMNGHAAWLCRCDCGKEIVTRSCDLRNGKTTSCGCFHKELVANITKSHELSGTRLYNIYSDMIQRCFNPKGTGYDNYGGRGITVCDDWKNNRQSFFDWAVAKGYSEALTLDRIDNDGNYCPDNCRWATASEQRINQRRMKKQKEVP